MHQNNPRAADGTYPLFVTIGAACVGATFFAQGFIEPTAENLTCAAFAAVSVMLTCTYCLSPRVMTNSPLSSLAIIGLCASTTGGALLVQTLSWRPLTYNLDLPIKTFSACAALSLLAIIVHSLYNISTKFSRARDSFALKTLGPFGAFKAPRPFELWILGFIGIAATWSAGLPATTSAVEFGDASGKFQQALIPFAIAPFIIPLRQYLTADQRRPTFKQLLAISAYFALLLIVSMARNSRGTFAVTALSIGLGVFLAIAIGRLKPTRKTVITFLFLAPLAAMLLGGLSNLATAMVIARSSRDTASAASLIRETVSIAQDPALIQRRRQADSILTNGYNEVYISNPLMARLVHIKFIDLNLRHADGITESQIQRLYDDTGRRIAYLAPTPILQHFGVAVDKAGARYSSGDLYRNLASRGRLGGFTSGSSIADGLTMFGVAFWPFMAAVFLVFFFILDMLVVRLESGYQTFSAVALFNLPLIFSGAIVAESVASFAGTLLRSLPQAFILTCLLLWLARAATSTLLASRR